jgi:hypothetical protein
LRAGFFWSLSFWSPDSFMSKILFPLRRGGVKHDEHRGEYAAARESRNGRRGQENQTAAGGGYERFRSINPVSKVPLMKSGWSRIFR